MGLPLVQAAEDPRAMALRTSLTAALGAEIVAAWFNRLQIVAVADGCAVLSVPTRFLQSWITRRYSTALAVALAALDASLAGFTLVVRDSACAAAGNARLAGDTAAVDLPETSPPSAVLLPALPAPRDRGLFRPLAAGARFETFIAAPGNALARSSAAALAATDGGPLVLVGPTGAGKSHLAHATVAAMREAGGRAAVVDCWSLAAALRHDGLDAVLALCESLDALVVDDVDQLAKGAAEKFGVLLRRALGSSCAVCLTAMVPLDTLDAFAPDLRSRCVGGLVASIAPPDAALRGALLDAAFARVAPGITLPPDVRGALVAPALDARALNGIANRLAALRGMGRMPETAAAALSEFGEMLRSIAMPLAPKVKIKTIQQIVAAHYGVTCMDMLSARRTANVVRPRQVAMYLVKLLTPHSMPEIGRRFGNRDHTTILHGVRRIADAAAADEALRGELALLRGAIEAMAAQA